MLFFSNKWGLFQGLEAYVAQPVLTRLHLLILCSTPEHPPVCPHPCAARPCLYPPFFTAPSASGVSGKQAWAGAGAAGGWVTMWKSRGGPEVERQRPQVQSSLRSTEVLVMG